MPRAPVALTAAALALLLASCVGSGDAVPSPSTTPEPSPTSSPSAPSPGATTPSPSARTEDPIGTYRPGDGPPDLFLSVDGASPVVGLPGGGCWASSTEVGCADTGWLVPETPIEAERGARLWVEVGAPFALTGWDVVAEAADVPFDGEPALRLANRQLGPAVPPTPIILASLPSGDWVVAASVWFKRGGDVSFYWRVVVR